MCGGGALARTTHSVAGERERPAADRTGDPSVTHTVAQAPSKREAPVDTGDSEYRYRDSNCVAHPATPVFIRGFGSISPAGGAGGSLKPHTLPPKMPPALPGRRDHAQARQQRGRARTHDARFRARRFGRTTLASELAASDARRSLPSSPPDPTKHGIHPARRTTRKRPLKRSPSEPNHLSKVNRSVRRRRKGRGSAARTVEACSRLFCRQSGGARRETVRKSNPVDCHRAAQPVDGRLRGASSGVVRTTRPVVRNHPCAMRASWRSSRRCPITCASTLEPETIGAPARAPRLAAGESTLPVSGSRSWDEMSVDRSVVRKRLCCARLSSQSGWDSSVAAWRKPGSRNDVEQIRVTRGWIRAAVAPRAV